MAKSKWGPGQDGCVGKHGLPPRITTAKTTTRLQKAITQNCE